MRVVTRARRDDRGAIAVIVAICSVMLFAFAAYAIDLGNAWQTRRNIVTGSDAASLAAARTLHETGQTGCDSVATDYLERNVDDVTLLNCTAQVTGPAAGHVTVQGQTTADFALAGIFGDTSEDIESSTTAEWGIPTGISGLRPFGLCIDANQQFKDWLNFPNGPSGPSGEIKITYSKEQAAACGGNVPGNWGVVDFDGGSNSTGEIQDWIQNGYDGEVELPSQQFGQPGAFSPATNTELNFLRDSAGWFALPVFDAASGSGNNAKLHVVAAVYVNLVDYKSNGPEAGRYLTLKFDRGVVAGTCCDNTGIDTGLRSLRICDVDTLAPDTSAKGC